MSNTRYILRRQYARGLECGGHRNASLLIGLPPPLVEGWGEGLRVAMPSPLIPLPMGEGKIQSAVAASLCRCTPNQKPTIVRVSERMKVAQHFSAGYRSQNELIARFRGRQIQPSVSGLPTSSG